MSLGERLKLDDEQRKLNFESKGLNPIKLIIRDPKKLENSKKVIKLPTLTAEQKEEILKKADQKLMASKNSISTKKEEVLVNQQIEVKTSVDSNIPPSPESRKEENRTEIAQPVIESTPKPTKKDRNIERPETVIESAKPADTELDKKAPVPDNSVKNLSPSKGSVSSPVKKSSVPSEGRALKNQTVLRKVEPKVAKIEKKINIDKPQIQPKVTHIGPTINKNSPHKTLIGLVYI